VDQPQRILNNVVYLQGLPMKLLRPAELHQTPDQPGSSIGGARDLFETSMYYLRTVCLS